MSEKPVIIIKKKKHGHGGHHGGAWKVAYADFVTAMMAFFLLLWLLGVTTAEQRQGLAEFFSDANQNSIFGGGARFGAPPIAIPEKAEDARSEGVEDIPDKGQGAKDADEEVAGEGILNTSKIMGAEDVKVALAMQQEEETFKEAGEYLKENIMKDTKLKEFADQIIVDRTPEGLRIQIVDKEKLSMFPSANAIPYEKSRDLLVLIGRVISMLPNKISISGHTDSSPFVVGSNRDNWTLSTERANVSRMYLVKGGVKEEQISRVMGFADRQPFSENPKDPRNRRISIILMRRATFESGIGQGTSGATPKQ